MVKNGEPRRGPVQRCPSEEWSTAPQNKGMKQTKPAQAMELRSLSPVFAAFSRNERPRCPGVARREGLLRG